MRIIFAVMAIGLLFICNLRGFGQSLDGGTIVGRLKSLTNTQDGKNINFEVLAPGEEKPRNYHVLFDQKLKKPMPKVLEAVRAASIGDIVEIEWQKTGHGPAVKSFKVVSTPNK